MKTRAKLFWLLAGLALFGTCGSNSSPPPAPDTTLQGDVQGVHDPSPHHAPLISWPSLGKVVETEVFGIRLLVPAPAPGILGGWRWFPIVMGWSLPTLFMAGVTDIVRRD